MSRQIQKVIEDYMLINQSISDDMLKSKTGDLSIIIPIQNEEVSIPELLDEIKFGKTKYGWRRLLRGPIDLFTIWLLNSFQEKPMYLFGRIVFLSLVVSLFSGLIWLYQRFFLIKEPFNTAQILLSIFTGILNFQLFVSGFLGEMIKISNNKRDTHLKFRRVSSWH